MPMTSPMKICVREARESGSGLAGDDSATAPLMT